MTDDLNVKFIDPCEPLHDGLGKRIWVDWDYNSPAHNYYKRWAKRNFLQLKKLSWIKIYKQARELT